VTRKNPDSDGRVDTISNLSSAPHNTNVNKQKETSGQLARKGQLTVQRTANSHGRNTALRWNPSRKRQLGETIRLNC